MTVYNLLLLQGLLSKTLQDIDDGDILSMRRQGHLIYQAYFRDEDSLMDTITAALMQKLGIEPQQYAVEK